MEQSVTSLSVKYLERSKLRESSVEIYSRAIRWFVELSDDLDVRVIDYGHAEDFKTWLAKGRSESAANTYLRPIKAFFSWLARRRYVDRDPFDGIKLYIVAEKKFDIYSLDEIARMLKVADLRWQVIISLALNSMRQGEILNLVLSDIDFDKNLILVTPKKDTAYTWRWDIKDYNQAYIGLPACVVPLLIELREQLAERQPYINLTAGRYYRQMVRKQAGTLTHRLRNCPWGNFNRDFKGLLERAHVKRKRFHDLRSTFATVRYNDGYSLKELQYLLRHSSIQTTARYVRNLKEEKLVAKSIGTFTKYYASNVP